VGKSSGRGGPIRGQAARSIGPRGGGGKKNAPVERKTIGMGKRTAHKEENLGGWFWGRGLITLFVTGKACFSAAIDGSGRQT